MRLLPPKVKERSEYKEMTVGGKVPNKADASQN